MIMLLEYRILKFVSYRFHTNSNASHSTDSVLDTTITLNDLDGPYIHSSEFQDIFTRDVSGFILLD